MPWTSSSVTSGWSSPVFAVISSWSFAWMDGFLTSSAMIHCSAVDVVSVPALRNSEQSLMISSSVSARLPSSGSLMSSSVSTYECSSVVSLFVWHEELPLPAAEGVDLLEAAAEEVLGDRREVGEDGHLARDVDEQVALGVLDGAHRGLVEALAEAHVHEEAEHGVLERVHDVVGCLAGRRQLVDDDAVHPVARRREQAGARRVQRLGDEVAAEEAPHGPVPGARDDVVVLAEEPARRHAGAVGQRGAALDERRVREAAVGDEDGHPRPHAQRHDGAVPSDQPLEEQLRLDVGQRLGQQHDAAEQRHRRRAGREAAAALAAIAA
ncbi:hypothetical protein EE612_052283, partial [Oryza sativa]